MSKFQVFLIVLYLFFLRRRRRLGAGAAVQALFLRREPGAQMAEPRLPVRPCLPLYGFGTVLLFILSELDHTLFGSFSGTFWY